jgi:hypothetical protein
VCDHRSLTQDQNETSRLSLHYLSTLVVWEGTAPYHLCLHSVLNLWWGYILLAVVLHFAVPRRKLLQSDKINIRIMFTLYF